MIQFFIWFFVRQVEIVYSLVEQWVFLMLQGLYGLFFDCLVKFLCDVGSMVWCVGFNVGDEYFWIDFVYFICYIGMFEEWLLCLDVLIQEKGVIDIVFYGDVCLIYVVVCEVVLCYGLVLYVFEEGYLWFFWIIYECGGLNGYLVLMDIELCDMCNVLCGCEGELVNCLFVCWGDMWQYKFYGVLYYFFVLIVNGCYKGYCMYCQIGVFKEFWLNFCCLLMMFIDMLVQ